MSACAATYTSDPWPGRRDAAAEQRRSVVGLVGRDSARRMAPYLVIIAAREQQRAGNPRSTGGQGKAANRCALVSVACQASTAILL
jgi:hypothetical protein